MWSHELTHRPFLKLNPHFSPNSCFCASIVYIIGSVSYFGVIGPWMTLTVKFHIFGTFPLWPLSAFSTFLTFRTITVLPNRSPASAIFNPYDPVWRRRYWLTPMKIGSYADLRFSEYTCSFIYLRVSKYFCFYLREPSRSPPVRVSAITLFSASVKNHQSCQS